MIKLKSTNKTQTFYIAKGCSDVCIKDNTLPLGSYTKAESDARYQPKGDYPTIGDIDRVVGEVIESYTDDIKNDVTDLQNTKQDKITVDEPLIFQDNNISIDLSEYATKDDLENIDVSGKQDVLVSGVNIKTINNESILGPGNIDTKYTAGDNISILDSEISWEAPNVQFVNTIFTDNEALKYAIADFSGEYIEKEFPLATTESAGLMSPEDKAKLDAGSSEESIPYLYIIPDGFGYILGDGDYAAVKDAVINNKPYLIYWVNNTKSGTTAQFGELVSLFETAEWANNILQVRFHFEEGNVHIHQLFDIWADGTVISARQVHTYVTQADYDAKVTEIDTAISNLEDQIGNIGTVLDNIQGEVI